MKLSTHRTKRVIRCLAVVTVAAAVLAPAASAEGVSNIMKTKHDTVKNSISNVR